MSGLGDVEQSPEKTGITRHGISSENMKLPTPNHPYFLTLQLIEYDT